MNGRKRNRNLLRGAMILVACLALTAGTVALAKPHGRGPGMGHHPGAWGEGHGHGGPGGFLGRMADRLDLSAEQRDQIRAIVRESMEGELGALQRAHGEARHQLEMMIRDPEAAPETIAQAARELGASGEQLAVKRHELSLAVFGVLTEEQRQKAKELRAERQERFEQRMERFGPGAFPDGE